MTKKILWTVLVVFSGFWGTLLSSKVVAIGFNNNVVEWWSVAIILWGLVGFIGSFVATFIGISAILD